MPKPKVKTPSQMKAEMAVGRARTVLPQAEREENLGKFLEGSKIKDRLYHITPENFSEFKPGGEDPTRSGPAIWLTPNTEHMPAAHNISYRDEQGRTYPISGANAKYREGTNVMPVHVQAKNPLVLDDPTMIDWAQTVFAGGSREFPELMPPKWVEEVRKEGYDSIILADPRKSGQSHEVIMFDPAKIKSAIGNEGTYDITNPDITKAHGGAVHMQDGGSVKPPPIFETAQVPFSEVRRELGMKDGGDAGSGIDINRLYSPFSVLEKPSYGSEIPGTPTIDQQRYELTVKGQQEAENRARRNRDNLSSVDPAGTLGVSDVLTTLGKGIVAAPAYIAGNVYDWLRNNKVSDEGAKARGQAIEEWMQPKTQEGAEFLETLGEIPEKITGATMGFGMHPNLWVTGAGMPTPAQMRAGLKLGASKYGTPLAEKGLSMWEAGRDPLSAVSNRMTGSTGNPLVADIFAGSKSKTADLAMRDIAQARLIAGEDPAVVWKETGWTAPPYGGDMRYEIPDTGLSTYKIQGAVEKKFMEQHDKFFDLRDARAIRMEMAAGKTLDEAIDSVKSIQRDPPTQKAIDMATDASIDDAKLNKDYYATGKKTLSQYTKTVGKLGKQIEHEELFAAYPDFANLIRFETMIKDKVAGEFDPHSKKLKLNVHTIRRDPKSTTAHELQHAVQHREETSPGGSPSGVKNSPQQFDPVTASEFQALKDRIISDTGRLGELHRQRESGNITAPESQELNRLTQALPEYSNYMQARQDFLSQGTPTELYKRLAGEAEARLTQHRLNLTPQERLAQYPYDPAYFKSATGYSIDDIINNVVREGSSISDGSVRSTNKNGGKVSFANDIDAMRHELTKAK